MLTSEELRPFFMSSLREVLGYIIIFTVGFFRIDGHIPRLLGLVFLQNT